MMNNNNNISPFSSSHPNPTNMIQNYLEENERLILAIMEARNLGNLDACAQYEDQLSKNLSFLAQIADAQLREPAMPAQTPPPPPQTQMHGMNFTQMLGWQTQHPFFQGAAAGGPMQFGHTAAAGGPFFSQPVSAAPIYSQSTPAAPSVPQIFQAPSSAAPNATPSWANN